MKQLKAKKRKNNQSLLMDCRVAPFNLDPDIMSSICCFGMKLLFTLIQDNSCYSHRLINLSFPICWVWSQKLGRDLSTRKITFKNVFFRKTILIWKLCMCVYMCTKKLRKKNATQLYLHSVTIAKTRNATTFRCSRSAWFVSIVPPNELCVVMQNLYSLWTLCFQNY